MKEKPSWYKSTIEGGRNKKPNIEAIDDAPVIEEVDPLLAELLAEKQFILDSAPDNWEAEIDHEALQEFRTDILKWTPKEIIAFSRNNDIWSDPTYAKALLDVISGKITPPIKSN
jgi:hypothetical protein